MARNPTTEPGGPKDDGNKKSLRTPRTLIQTTLSARVEPREEGKRHWTHRTEIMPIGELERTVHGSREATAGQNHDAGPESAQGGARRSGNQLPGDPESAKNGAAPQATDSTTSHSKTVAGTRPSDHRYDGSDMETDDEDELSQAADAASKTPPSDDRKQRDLFQTPSAGTKRKGDVVNVADDDDDMDDLLGEMDSEEERQLTAIAESSSRAVRARDAFATPSGPKTTNFVAGVPTPSLTGKPVRRVLFAEPDDGDPRSAKKPRHNRPDTYASVSELRTPSSSQGNTGPSSSPTTPGSGSRVEDIKGEVLGLLKGQKIDDQVLRRVESALQRLVAKAKGLEKGRDTSRQELKAQEANIAQLRMRIVDLENKRKLDLDALKKVKSGLMNLYTES
jgi:hypothetical protein